MLLTIKNIGLIDNASIRLDGLTVIGGENDMGKSTAGKLMFAITKALVDYESFSTSKDVEISAAIKNIYLNLRKINTPNVLKYIEQFNPDYFIQNIQKVKSDSKAITEFLKYKHSLINGDKLLPVSFRTHIIEKLNIIKSETLKIEDKTDLIKNALNKTLTSEFHFEISPNDKPSKITITENEILLLDIDIENNEIKSVVVGDIFNFEDVTFIETPLVLQLSELISYADTLFEVTSEDRNVRLGSLNRPTISLRFKDLMNKLQKSNRIETLYHNSTVDYWKSVSDTINGTFEYSTENRDFIFKRKDKKKTLEIKSLNTASGIKSFGIIQLLLQAGFIDERTLLIIDEPETHLHPKWQIEYAKLLIELVKNDFNILVTSHSPYIIQALRVLSEKEDVHERTAFYLAEKNSKNRVEFEDVSRDIKILFKKLAEPLNQILWQ